jgi:ribosomal protein S12 methylthiotransferase accessory factor
VARLQAAELFVSMEEITHDVGIPAFRTLLADRAFPGQEGRSVGFDGLGCDLDAENALMRSIGEAAQSHTGVLLGARERFDGGDEATPSAAGFLHRLLTPALRVPFTPTAPPPDLDARLAQVLDRLRSAGLHQCVVVDLTREDLALPVVRAVIPGACGLFGQTPRRPGLRLLRHLV